MHKTHWRVLSWQGSVLPRLGAVHWISLFSLFLSSSTTTTTITTTRHPRTLLLFVFLLVLLFFSICSWLFCHFDHIYRLSLSFAVSSIHLTSFHRPAAEVPKGIHPQLIYTKFLPVPGFLVGTLNTERYVIPLLFTLGFRLYIPSSSSGSRSFSYINKRIELLDSHASSRCSDFSELRMSIAPSSGIIHRPALFRPWLSS